MRTLVLGLGNPILTDDGVGVRVAEAVQAQLPPGVPVDVREVGVGGLTLMEMMVGYDRVILIDAMNRRNGEPGTIRRMTLEDLRAISPTQHSASVHDASLVTALEMGRRMGLHLPEDIVIYAVDVENVTNFSEEPTPAVAAAIPEVTAAVLEELRLPKSVAPEKHIGEAATS
ncbi:MAG: Hydrogenase 2 maturation protease [Anaerolineales bacterium]|nr:Hydrogenase 2 maturation protease [Anaerolineales bacterium]